MSEEYFAGRGCTCAAYSSNECACDADWTDPEVYELRNQLNTANQRIQRCYDMMITGDPEMEFSEISDRLISTVSQLVSSKMSSNV